RVTLENAAKQACLSPFHFSRVFTQVFGETPHEFVTKMRVEEAKKLLLAGDSSVTEICFEIGYESLGSFSARFRSLTGLSPKEFRGRRGGPSGVFAAPCPFYSPPACFHPFNAGPRTSR